MTTTRPLSLLLVTARVPRPGRRGDQLRAWQQARLLARHHRVTVACLSAEPDDGRAREELEAQGVRVALLRPPLLGTVWSLARALPTRLPLQAALCRSGRLERLLAHLCAEVRPDLVQVQLARLGPCLAAVAGRPRAIDFVDALSLNMERRRAHERGPLGWLAGQEAARLRRYERELCEVVDAAVVVAERDREAIGGYANLHVVPNGVDLDAFPDAPAPRAGSRLVFSGNLGYFANVQAATWFAREVLPLVRRRRPEVTLHLVGARPAAALRALARADPAVAVAGPVADVAVHLRGAALAVAPMRAGSGQQLKVLEALASGTPLVATAVGVSGTDVRHGEHVLVADTAEAFAAAVLRLLDDPGLAGALSRAGRRLVEQRYTWEASVAALEAVHAAVVRR